MELIFRIILGQGDIMVNSVHTQESMKNLQGCSAILDVHAVDSTNNVNFIVKTRIFLYN